MNSAGASATAVPPREGWPEPDPETAAGRALTDLVMATFTLHGRFMAAAEEMAAAGGITAARWQVIGACLDQPRPVAEIARRMGMTRQSVQRTADLLAERGLVEYRPNPAHRRSKLVACTEAGYWAVRRICLLQHPWAARVGGEIGAAELDAAVATIQRLTAELDRAQADLRARQGDQGG